MGYTDDWESLMNGVFGPGGKLRYDTQKPPEKTGLPDLNAALLEQQKKLDEMLKKQNAALRGGTAQETLAQSRKMLEEMEADGLLAKGTAEVGQEHLGSFEGLAAEVKKTVLGQDAFVDGVVRAMRRPFVLGTEPPTARNVILLCGAPGTGRHFTLTETARCMAARGLLRSDRLAVMDLALYPGSGAEKLFLQDLYAALHAPGEIVVFEHYESCCPGFLKTLADLAVRGSAPLSSRYLVNKEGILVDAGTALAPGAVSRITPCGKYLVFFSRKGRAALADRFGAPFVSALGDVCETAPFAREDLAALAAQQLNALAAKVKARLGLTLAAGADVRDYVAGQCSPQQGVAGLTVCCDRMFRALSEYCLQTDAALTGTVSLTAREGGIDFALNYKAQGGDVTEMTVLGNDVFADALVERLKQRDIPLRVLKRIDRPTGMAKMDLVDGDKKHLEFHGNAMEEIELSAEDMEFVKGFDIVYAERWAKVERYIAALRQPGQIWVYDFSKRLEQPSNDALLPYLDYAFFSYDKDDDYIREFMRRTKAKGAGCVIAMLGEHGSLAYDGQRFYQQAAENVPVVNTVGAGDSYIAAFTYGVSLGESIPQCMARGKALATRIVQQFDPYLQEKEQ